MAEIQAIIEKLDNDPAGQLPSSKAFKKTLVVSMRHLNTVIRAISKNMKHSFSVIQHNAVDDQALAYLPLAMKPVYDECVQIKGKGSKAKRKELLMKRVTLVEDGKGGGVGIFMAVHRGVEENTMVALAQDKQQLTDKVQEIFDLIWSNFNMSCSDMDFETPDSKAFRDSLRAEVKKAQKMLNGTIKPWLEQCKKKV
ncbi:hypothetical protein LTS18_000096 [Coniosporium uncinatum]|uniref:Uncharacterized protein n=1 Tax=Coniosporium uncinatum TaxID=93489 RepID=A0ACC3DZP0_9PEZI|nr:hypothetical protein LTS18_000096 [Coniosporium uncinatum]